MRRVERPKEDSIYQLSLISNVTLPQGDMTLAARDDTAEYDETNKQDNFNDDPE